MKRNWLFQNDPSKYNLEGSLKKCDILHWQVRGKNVSMGDTAYFFECSPNYRICAIGQVISQPVEMLKNDCENPFILSEGRRNLLLRVKVEITNVLEEPISIFDLDNNPILNNNKLIRNILIKGRSLPGPTFKMTKTEAETLENIIKGY
jgi:hypothetical protein